MTDALYDFIDTIFPDDLLGGHEHICYWASKKVPGFPIGESALERALEGKQKRALYFGTATVRLTEGELRNRLSAFSGLWVVVLDDIGDGAGAKCPLAELPEGIWDAASYRVETSPGNYQLGFVLDEPVRDVEAARELVRIIYEAGPWDGGGAMPTKLVRLPGGYNLKDKYQQDGRPWQVKLDHLSDVVYSPDELLHLVHAGVGWADVLAGKSTKKDPRRGRGTTPYRGGARMDLHGVVDPLLEWLNDNELILNERYPFVDVICPWHEEHSEGTGNTAGYSPLGWGEDHHKGIRGFKCFHDHCRDRGSKEFIQWAMGLRAPPVAVHDPIAPLLTRYVLDCQSMEWVDIQSPDMHRIPDRGFKAKYNADIYFPKTGKVDEWAYAPTYSLMLKNPGTLKVVGSCFDPGEDLIVSRDDDNQFINDCRIPWHGSGTVDRHDVDRFRDFMEYLLPNGEDAEFFIRHLAAKVQNPRYRGPAFFMYTPTQGTGRGTLGKLLGKLWGAHNVRMPSMPKMLEGLSGAGFNDQLRGLWLVVSESRDAETRSARMTSGQYESFKAFVEPAPTQVTYNKKFGGQWTELNYSSVIVCSNHPDGMGIDVTDRRIKRCMNVIERRDDQYFTGLHQWLDRDEWQPSVWQYLAEYDCGDYTGTEPISHSQDIDDLVAQQSPIDFTQYTVFSYLDDVTGGIFRVADVIEALEHQPGLLMNLGLADMRSNWKTILRKALTKHSRGLKHERGEKDLVVKHKGVATRFRAASTKCGGITWQDAYNDDLTSKDIGKVYENFSGEALVHYVKQRMEDVGLG